MVGFDPDNSWIEIGIFTNSATAAIGISELKGHELLHFLVLTVMQHLFDEVSVHGWYIIGVTMKCFWLEYDTYVTW